MAFKAEFGHITMCLEQTQETISTILWEYGAIIPDSLTNRLSILNFVTLPSIDPSFSQTALFAASNPLFTCFHCIEVQ